MDRKAFISRSIQAALCCCGATMTVRRAAGNSLAAQAVALSDEVRDDRIEFAKTWVRRLMDVLDAELDEDTKYRIIESCGRACYEGSHGPATGEQQMGIDAFIAGLQEYVGAENCFREGERVHFSYGHSGRADDGSSYQCLCPLMKDGPKELSNSFCQCSVGYLREMFGRVLGYTPEIDLLESIRRGGSRCRFDIHLRA